MALWLSVRFGAAADLSTELSKEADWAKEREESENPNTLAHISELTVVGKARLLMRTFQKSTLTTTLAWGSIDATVLYDEIEMCPCAFPQFRIRNARERVTDGGSKEYTMTTYRIDEDWEFDWSMEITKSKKAAGD